jgi:hypothetical protein
MEQSNAWRSFAQEVGVPELLRTRTRTRRRRRKRAWVAPWAYLLQGWLSLGTRGMGPALFSLAIIVLSREGGPAEYLCLIAHSH